jgi:cytochrome b pre-mRNA-processing protein 3
MSLLSSIFRPRGDDRAYVRPLWHRTVELARDRRWYAECGVADTVAGRFDAVTLMLALVLLRMERPGETGEALIPASVHMTELFVDDMDGQLRQSGVGDLSVGKHIGKLMSVLGGRLGALRDALPQGLEALTPVIARNVTLAEGADPVHAAALALDFTRRLSATSDADLLAARIAP